MMDSGELFSGELLDEAALQLFGSSDGGRYWRESMRLAESSGLVEKAGLDHELLDGLWNRARTLLAEVESSRLRGMAEVELAVLACVLTNIGGADAAAKLLNMVGEEADFDSGSAGRWIQDLVERLACAYG